MRPSFRRFALIFAAALALSGYPSGSTHLAADRGTPERVVAPPPAGVMLPTSVVPPTTVTVFVVWGTSNMGNKGRPGLGPQPLRDPEALPAGIASECYAFANPGCTRFKALNDEVPIYDYDYRDDVRPDLVQKVDHAQDLEADVCRAFAFCSMIQESVAIKVAQVACYFEPGDYYEDPRCGGWYTFTPDGPFESNHWGQAGLNQIGNALGATAAAHGASDPVPWEVGVEVPNPSEWCEEPEDIPCDSAVRAFRLYVYDDTGTPLDGYEDGFPFAPSYRNPDWTASFDGDPAADWVAPSWSSLGTAFVTLEVVRVDPGPVEVPVARYVYVPTAAVYGATETDFFRPTAETGSAAILLEVSVTDAATGAVGVAARNGAWAATAVAPSGEREAASFEDVFAGSYVVPYDHDHYAAACSWGCGGERPGYFLTPVDYLPDGTGPLRFTFAAEANVVLPSSWGAVAWDVQNLELAFPEGRRLVVEGALEATGVTLTEAEADAGWGGVVFREGSGGVAGVSALTGVTVEKVRREPPQGGCALPKGAVEVAGRVLTLDGTEIVSSGGGITGLLVSGAAAEVTVTGESLIRLNDGGGIYASGGAEVTVSGASLIELNSGGAGVSASGYGTLVNLEGATVSQNSGVGVRALSQGLVLFANDDEDPATTVENNAGGLDAQGGSNLVAGVCTDTDPVPCPGRNMHFLLDNDQAGASFDARSLGGSYVTAEGNDWDVLHLDDLVLVEDGSSWLAVCPIFGAGGCGVDGRLAGDGRRGDGGSPPPRLQDVLALVDEAERARMAGDMTAFELAASAVVAAIDTSATEEERRAVFEATARLFAWAQPAGPLAALEALTV